MTTAAILLGLLVLISYVVEALRTAPKPQERLPWAPDIPIRYITVNGLRIRYIVTGEGPALVLLHTLRTQLDMFQKVVPKLAQRFQVYALDYPGHGYSDIPRVDYTADFFVTTVGERSRCCSRHEGIRECDAWSRSIPMITMVAAA